VRRVRNPRTGGPVFTRIGLHTGDVIGGVIGTRSFRYDVWGGDVLAANAMESAGVPGGILVSETTRAALMVMQSSAFAVPGLRLVPAGVVAAKGRGDLNTYFVHIEGMMLATMREAV
jgi:class 3 adenylate cyclase